MAQSSFSVKLQALQNRDKELRESRERQTDIETATAVTGCCPDMCPELERLFREETNQLSPLEFSNGEPDPHAMVKEYRRAGADQSEPLAHELRPGPVLSRTMDYLMCNIMDRDAETDSIPRSEWYDFLWSRTRAIRKDITQQHLCDQQSVALLEKCTRFHIHCSAVLIEEDTATFDPRINDENLRKCLQSLKDFYHDLSQSHGIVCPNEPEFRAYEILINLTDSDILREVKHLRRDIINSPQVKFAIDSFFALSSNNFVRFFKLVKSTTYLNACLLHRYFNRVRIQAIKLLRRAVTIPKSTSLYPESELIRQLGFDDEQQLAAFCNSMSLVRENGFVHLTREELSEQRETPLVPPARSYRLVEGKRTVSVGQVVNGGPLPVNPYKKYPLHSSFDADGNLKPNALTQTSPQKKPIDIFSPFDSRPQDQTSFSQPVTSSVFPQFVFGPAATSSSQPAASSSGFSFLKQAQQFAQQAVQQTVQPPVIEKTPGISPEVIAAIAEKFTDDITDEVCADLIVPCVTGAHSHAKLEQSLDRQAAAVGDRLVAEYLEHVVANIVQKEYSDALEVKRVADRRRMILEAADYIFDQILGFHVHMTAQTTITEMRTERIIQTSQELADRVIGTSTKVFLAQLLQEVIDDAVKKRDIKVKEQIDRRRTRIERKYFRIWLANYRKAKKLRHLKATFPASHLEVKREIVVQATKSGQNSKKKRPSPVVPVALVPNKRQRSKSPVGHHQTPIQLRRSSRSTALLNASREKIRDASDNSFSGRLKRLQQGLREEEARGLRSDELAGTVARALVHTEEFYE